jgi:DNA-binding MarR family transcriptional regulator
MLDLELLRAFVAVADCGGFHRAAERLNLTQSTVSQQIKRLEREKRLSGGNSGLNSILPNRSAGSVGGPRVSI